MWTIDNTTLGTWFERDRAHVSLTEKSTGASILDVWDEEVAALAEDGFLDPATGTARRWSTPTTSGCGPSRTAPPDREALHATYGPHQESDRPMLRHLTSGRLLPGPVLLPLAVLRRPEDRAAVLRGRAGSVAAFGREAASSFQIGALLGAARDPRCGEVGQRLARAAAEGAVDGRRAAELLAHLSAARRRRA
jgi:hypothetical protein